MAIANRYHIHRHALADRRWRDGAWFWYAWTLDTLLLTRHLVIRRRIVPTFQQIAGRLKATADLLLHPEQSSCPGSTSPG